MAFSANLWKSGRPAKIILQIVRTYINMGGSTKSQKAGTLKQLEAKIVKKPASYRDYVGT